MRRRRCLAGALLLGASLVAAGCGDEEGHDLGARGADTLDARPRLLPQRRPRGHLRRPSRDGDFRQAGLDVAAAGAVGSGRAAEAARRRQGRPGDLLRARAAAGPRQGPAARRRSARSSRSRSPRSSSLGLQAGSARPRDLAGKRVGTAGIPYQSAYLKTILEKAGARSDLGAARSTSASTSCPRCSRARSTRPSAASGTTRASSCACAQATRRSSAIDQAGVPTYDELVFVARQDDCSPRAARKVRRFLQALARGYARGARPIRRSAIAPLVRPTRPRSPGSSSPA